METMESNGGNATDEVVNYAIQHGKETIGMTQTGKDLLHLGKSVDCEGWKAAFAIWAENAEGVVHVFVDNPRIDSIWITVEKEILLRNPKVPVVIEHISEGGKWIINVLKGSSL